MANDNKRGLAAGFADARQRLMGCLAGSPDAYYLRAFAAELRLTAQQAVTRATLLDNAADEPELSEED